MLYTKTVAWVVVRGIVFSFRCAVLLGDLYICSNISGIVSSIGIG